MNQPPPTTAAANSTSSKYFDLARKIKEIEMENAKLSLKLDKSNQHLFRLRLERSILMDKLKTSEPKLETTNEAEIKGQVLKELQEQASLMTDELN